MCQVLGVSSSKLSSREFNAFFNLTEKGEELAIDFEKICDRQKMNAEFVENELANPFRLIRFSISNHGKTLYDIKFCNPEQNSMPVQPFVSLLLGDNGAGKSFVLSQLVDVIRFLRKFYRDSKIDTLKYDTYKLEYRAWTNHCITLSRKTVYDKNDNCGYEVTDDCSKSPKSGLPSHLLAVAFSNDDKFGFSRNKEFYAYLGLRTVSNAAFLKSTKDIFLDRLILISKIQEKREAFCYFLSQIGFKPELNLCYQNNGAEESISILSSETDFDKLQKAHEICKQPKFVYQIQFAKGENKVDWEWISSGERNLLQCMGNILCYIDSHSLVIIDEPETSLHPKWQSRYIADLMGLFKAYPFCHFIISSHSHFLASSLSKKSSSIISLSVNDDGITHESRELPVDVEGSSAERILYEVFGVATSRNWYFEQDLKKMVQYMEEYRIPGNNCEITKDEFKHLFEKLKSFDFEDENDPLDELLKEAEGCLD